MALSDEELEHLEKLARVKLSPESRERFREQLERIIDFVRRLQEVDTTTYAAKEYIADLKPYMRDDEAGSCLSRDVVLEEAPEREDGFFSVPPVIET